MLGKLMKYEWKSTWKLLVPANLLIIVMTILACITVRIDFYDSDIEGLEFVAVLIILMYVLSMFVVLVGGAIYLIYRFYTSTYGDQGYLLHTLPVDKHHIIIAKVLVSTLWIILSSFLMYMSVIFLFHEEGDIFEEFIDGISFFSRVFTGTGYGEKIPVFTMVMVFVTLLVNMFVRVLKVTACISLGQLSSNHKVMLSFAYYFAFYVIQQIVNGCYLMFMAYVSSNSGNWFFEVTWEFSLIMGLIYAVLLYMLTWHVMDKQLNLD